ncbi:MCE family protein [Actinomadura parmotrematis]|uniref:MCE family protein n=1 Tax=Actinomadura parmotrematis TaxID=2864039 RepID=A0ABS7FXJ1_9ACTN|nr:MCE family protein [Actinomadura parmotrematis]MBW8485151.1 MCE family protein [Actinomadura parmotrematis]
MTHSANPSGGGIPQRVLFRLLGLSMVIVLLLLVALTVAFYNKSFTRVMKVKVVGDRAGLQLLPHSDVKVRGLIVGEVRGTRVTENGAQIDLALDPDKAKLIPTGVQARLLPKTLFGEKYVDLEVPATAGPTGLHAGQTIEQDRSQAAVEIDKVLNNLLPVLQAVQPEKLNTTLNAIATALQGRGDQLGRDLEQADALLRKINPQLGTLVDDLRGLADVSDIYADAAPDLLQTLRNINVTSTTITDKRVQIEDLIPQVTGFAQNTDRFVTQNAPKIIGFNIANRQGLELIARYSPSLPCVFKGLAKLAPEAERVAGGNGSTTFNLTIEIVKPRPGYKYPLDSPEAKDYRNPRCYNLPNPKVPSPDYLALDGTEDDLWWKDAHGKDDPIPHATGRGRSVSDVFVDPGTAMSEKDKIKNLVGPLTRTQADQVPDVAALLYGPVLQGSVVTVK